jgi:hypothetical protein
LEGAVEGGIRDWGEVVSQLRPLLVTAGDKLGYVLETPQVSRATSRASDGDNAPGEADNQQGSRMPELFFGLLTPQRLHAELLGSTL